MYINKYWGKFIGGSDDSLNLVAFLEDQRKEEIPLSEIFAKIGLDKQNGGRGCCTRPDRGGSHCRCRCTPLGWRGDGLSLRH